MEIRKAKQQDSDQMWDIFQRVNARGDTLPFSESMNHDGFRSYWFGGTNTYVAVDDDEVIGMYKFGENMPDRGSHVANATYVVSPEAQGKGIGRMLVNHSLEEAKKQGFLAMQFNYVVSTNMPAVALYEKLGFKIAGSLPKAFRHEELGLVDIFVMHRFL